MADVIKFPSQPRFSKSLVKIRLYTEDEILVTLIAVNTYSMETYRQTAENIEFLEPEIVILCLADSIKSNLFSKEFKTIATTILNNVERIE